VCVDMRQANIKKNYTASGGGCRLPTGGGGYLPLPLRGVKISLTVLQLTDEWKISTFFTSIG